MADAMSALAQKYLIERQAILAFCDSKAGSGVSLGIGIDQQNAQIVGRQGRS